MGEGVTLLGIGEWLAVKNFVEKSQANHILIVVEVAPVLLDPKKPLIGMEQVREL
jgi:hypothetical protein